MILNGFQYRHYVGRTMTNKAKSTSDLTAEEAFRVVPDKCMKPEGKMPQEHMRALDA